MMEKEPVETHRDYTLTRYCENAVTYIAGNVIKRPPCDQCTPALTTNDSDSANSQSLWSNEVAL